MRDGMQVVVGNIRPGSSLRFWKPNGKLEGVLEVNPDFPPRVHYLDGRIVEMEPVKVPVIRPLDPFSVSVHEHPPLVPGQEYPRDIGRIRPSGETDVEWRLPPGDDEGAKGYRRGK